jgi:hypothetical protein
MDSEQVFFGIYCPKCEELLHIRDSELDESIPLEELRRKLGKGWKRIVSHFALDGRPCGGFYTADDLIYLSDGNLG